MKRITLLTLLFGSFALGCTTGDDGDAGEDSRIASNGFLDYIYGEWNCSFCLSAEDSDCDNGEPALQRGRWAYKDDAKTELVGCEYWPVLERDAKLCTETQLDNPCIDNGIERN